MSETLIIFNAKVVTPLGFSARKGKEMAELRILEKATVEVVDGIITYVGPNRVKCVMDIIITSGITMLVGSVSCRVLSIHIPISYLGESGPKNFRGASKGRVICLSCSVAAV